MAQTGSRVVRAARRIRSYRSTYRKHPKRHPPPVSLYYRGVSSYYPPAGGGSDQDQMNASVNALSCAGFTLTGGYGLAAETGRTGCAPQTTYVNASVSSVPEPSTEALFGAGLAALAFAHRRRSQL